MHHLRITALSTFIPCDTSLHVTIDNTVHVLTPPLPSIVDPPYRLHFFLNPRDRLPYLRHIHDVNAQIRYCLDIITSLPATGSNNSWCRPMMLTRAHVPDLVATLTFPVDSVQHQLSIMTVATHLLLSVPYLKQTYHMCSTVRYVESHHHTLQLILKTVTLQRYYKVWCTVLDTRPRIRSPLFQ